MKRNILFLIVALAIALLFVSCVSSTVRVAEEANFANYRYINIDDTANADGYDVRGLVSREMSKSEENNQTHYDIIGYVSPRQSNQTITLSYKCDIVGNYVRINILLNDASTGNLLASFEGSDPIMYSNMAEEVAQKAMAKRLGEIKNVLNANFKVEK